MSADETPQGDDIETATDGETASDSGADVRERIEQGTDRAREQFDESVIDLLSWILDTETRARIYVHLRQHPDSTSDEVAEGTGLYPSTVREALAELHEEQVLDRQKRQNDGAGNNPYEYSAIPPSELVSEMIDDVQSQLNKVFNLDTLLDRRSDGNDEEPVRITVTEEEESISAEHSANGIGSEADDDSVVDEDGSPADTADPTPDDETEDGDDTKTDSDSNN